MFRKFLSVCCLFLIVGSATAYGQLRIGYMDTQDVLGKMPGRSEVQQKLSTFVQQKRQELQQRTSAYQDSVANFQESKSSMSEQQVKQQQQKLGSMESSLSQYQQKLQQQMQQKRTTLLNPLYEDIDDAIAAVAEDMNLDFVLNKSTVGGEDVIYYAADKKLNITQQVLQQINKTSDKD